MATENVVHQAQSSASYEAGAKQKAQAKTSRIPIKIVAAETLKKPDWIRVKAGSPSTRFYEIKTILREHKLHTVCEEASCPNIGECFGQGFLLGACVVISGRRGEVHGVFGGHEGVRALGRQRWGVRA